jgi:hypothetical protein
LAQSREAPFAFYVMILQHLGGETGGAYSQTF